MKQILFGALILSLAAHLAILFVDGNQIYTPFSGGGDTREYVEVAQNIVAGNGYTFAHKPTAFRAPLYPLLLAFLIRVSPIHWPIAVRILQLVFSLATAFLCAQLASRWFGGDCAVFAAIAILLFPTTLFFSGEILTECLAALIVVAFFCAFDAAWKTGNTRWVICVGVLAGIASLERFNMLPLIPFAALAFLFSDFKDSACWRRPTMVLAVAMLVLAPWLIHNEIAFRGKASYSTHGGFAAVEGVLMPLGRTQLGETEAIHNVLGWGNWDVETNTPVAPQLRDEATLNEQAWRVASQLWWKTGWRVLPLFVEKLSAFWFSTDQILDTSDLSRRARVVRFGGVAVYWLALGLAIAAWFNLNSTNPFIAKSLIAYAALVTAFHLPLTMNTRLRVPFFDPLVATLAACLIYRVALQRHGSETNGFRNHENAPNAVAR